MNLKLNVNKIHSELLEGYQLVNVKEDSNIQLGNFVEFSIIEENKELKLKITKYELEKSNFNWSYLSNPEDEMSVVERSSTTEGFIKDVKDIFEKNRFDSDYLKKLN